MVARLAVLLLLVSTLAIAGSASGQPVQWSGNGHWYEFVPTTLLWPSARDSAASRSFMSLQGHMATLTSQEEADWVWSWLQSLTADGAWLGGYQEPFESTPATANWRWVTGETWDYTNWAPGEPNDYDGFAEGYLAIWALNFPRWNDEVNWVTRPFLVEYSAEAPPTAMCFDGQDDSILLGNLGTSYSSFSFETLFQFDGEPVNDGIDHAMFYEGTGGEFGVSYHHFEGGVFKVAVAIKFSTYSWNGITIPFGEWADGAPHHLAVVYDSAANLVVVYVDGVQVGSQPLPDDNLQTPGLPAYIGRTGVGPWGFSAGRFAEVRLWDRPIQQTEMRERMWYSLAGDEAGLIGYWKLDEGAGNTAFDSAPNPHDGVISGAAWCSFSSVLSAGVPRENFPLRIGHATPNPSSSLVSLPIDRELDGAIDADVYSVSGELVRSLTAAEHVVGSGSIVWDGRDNRGTVVAPGLYIVRVTASGRTAVRKVLRIR